MTIESFRTDFNDWEWRMINLEDCPQSEVEEIRQAIRDSWKDPDGKAYWTWRVADEAAFSRELNAMASEAEKRIRARIALEGGVPGKLPEEKKAA